MAQTEMLNLNFDALTARMGVLRSLEEKTCWSLKAVLSKRNTGRWGMLRGVFRVSEREDASFPEESLLKYERYQFISRKVSGLSLASILSEIDQGITLPTIVETKNGPTGGDQNWKECIVPSVDHTGEGASRMFTCQLEKDVECPNMRLMGYQLPFHRSAHQFIEEFLGEDSFYGYQDARNGELAIQIPDLRGRVTLSEGTIGFRSNGTSLVLVGEVNGEPLSIESEEHRIPFEPGTTSDLELWLLDSDHQIVDYRSTSEWQHRFFVPDTANEVEALFDQIQRGEGETIEFKTYVSVKDNNRKRDELEKAVCAFSNFEGGKLLIGVEDDTEITGIERGCQRDYKGTIEHSLLEYEKDIRKHLRERLARPGCFTTSIAECVGVKLLIVDIRKSEQTNYLLSNKQAYVRRGASSARMSPEEIRMLSNDTKSPEY